MKEIAKVYKGRDSLKNEENYTRYHECAEELLEILTEDIPCLLKEEKFFKKVFYKKSS